MRWRDVKQGKKQKIKKKSKKEEKSYISDVGSITDRLKAFIVDSFMITMPILYLIFYFVLGTREAFSNDLAYGWTLVTIPHFIIITLFLNIKSQTPGYKAYELELVDVKTGSKPNILLIMFRYFLIPISIISIFGLLLVYFRKDKRTLHDLLSGTYPKKHYNVPKK